MAEIKNKRKNLWKWILGSLATLVVIVLLGGYFAINFIFDKAINMMLGGSVVSNLEQQLDQQLDQAIEKAQQLKSDTALNSSVEQTSQSVNSETADGSSNSDNSSNPQADSKPNQAKSNDAQQSSTDDSNVETGPKGGYVSPEHAKAVKENISFTDKLEVTSVLLSKLSANELTMFAELVGGGITSEEKKEAKKIFLQKLTEEEYNQLIDIAAKYGLSAGKTYQDSQKEYQGGP